MSFKRVNHSSVQLICLFFLLPCTMLKGAPIQVADPSNVVSMDSGSDHTWWVIDHLDSPQNVQISDTANDDSVLISQGWKPVSVPASSEFSGREIWYAKVFRVLGEADQPLAARLAQIDDRDRTYLNGNLIGQTGKWDSAFPEAYDKTRYYLVPEKYLLYGKNNVLLIHVRGYDLQYVGIIKDRTALGPALDIQKELYRETLVLFIFLSVYGTVAAYFFLLFIRRRDGLENLFFASFMTAMIAYFAVRSQLRFELGVGFFATKRIEYMLLELLFPLFYFFLHSLFPVRTRLDSILHKAAKVMCVTYLVLLLQIIFTDDANSWWLSQMYYAQPTWFIFIGILFIRLIGHGNAGSRDAIYLGFGFVPLVLGMMTDVAMSRGYFHAIKGVTLGFSVFAYVYFVFVLSMATILTNRYVRVHSEAERLNAELESKNHQLAQLDQMKDEFLANTSHELRTPLNGIIGLAESLADGARGSVPDGVRSDLGMIASSGKRLAHLVNDILDFSRLKNKDIELQKKAVDIRVAGDVVLALSKPLLDGKLVLLKNNISSDLPAVDADENRVQQILHNLVGNAIKFTEKGEVKISARVVDR